ncbi:MAG: hypothetical protein J6X50_03755 [Bacilli bacterium]|nr:hypothetical protein [Bacilli bacterium]
MSNVKKYILTAVTLGVIAASGALLIAGTNMITKDRIAENEQNSINNGITTIYGADSVAEEYALPEDSNYTYITKCYKVTSKENDYYFKGYAFRTDGSNNYGKISLIIGFGNNQSYVGLSIIANEQSFASTLKKGYLDPIKDGSQTIDDVSVSCGATYGAKLVRAMVEEAQKATDELLKVAHVE